MGSYLRGVVALSGALMCWLVSAPTGAFAVKPAPVAATPAPLASLAPFAGVAPFSSAAPSLDAGCATPGDAYTSAVLEDAPAVYYPMIESSGSVICDASGNELNGEYAPEGLTYGVAGPFGDEPDLKAIESDGAFKRKFPEHQGDIGTASTLTTLSGSQSFTLEGWFESTTPTNETLVGMTVFDGSTTAIAIWSGTQCATGSDTDLVLDEYGASNCWDPTSAAGLNLRDGKWHYLAIAYDAATNKATAYADGHDLGEQTSNNTFDWSDEEVLVGTWVDESINQSFVGDAAQVAIYPTALSGARITAHYKAATGGGGSLPRYTVAAKLEAEIPGPGGNTVTAAASGPSASCTGASCTVEEGESVTLTAHAAPGYAFREWAFGPCADTTNPTCKVEHVNSNVETLAQFLYEQPPTVSEYQATSVNDHSETVTAKIQPHGLSASYSIVYGTSTSYGSTLAGETVSGFSHTATFTLSGLLPGHKYDFEVQASSSGGPANGGNGTFITAGEPPPPPPPNVTEVHAAPGQGSATVGGHVTPGAGPQSTSYSAFVEYATEAEYEAAVHASPRRMTPYSHLASTVTVKYPSSPHAQSKLGELTGLASNTTYHYRVVVSAVEAGGSESSPFLTADATFKVPAKTPVMAATAPSSVSPTGATLNGTVNDFGIATTYSFVWEATYTGGNSCNSSGTPINGIVTASARALNGVQSVSLPLELTGVNALPEGSRVRYYIETGTQPFVSWVGGGQTFTSGSIPLGGDGSVEVKGDSAATLQAVFPSFAREGFANTQGIGPKFDGSYSPEFGLFEYSSSRTPNSILDVGATEFHSACANRVVSALSGLTPDTVYAFNPVAAYGRGTCPAADQYGDYYGEMEDYETYYCSTYIYVVEQFESGYQEGNYATRPPVEPTYSPELDPEELRFPSAYAPRLSPTIFFTTAATSEPSKAKVSLGTGAGSDGLTCGATATCSGTQTLKYAASAPAGGAATAAKLARQTTVVLASASFRIPPHKTRIVRFHLTAAGLAYLRHHQHILVVSLVTSERAGKGKRVTLTHWVPVARPSERRR